MSARTKPEAMRLIQNLDLRGFAAKAVLKRQLAADEVDIASQEYRHYMLLVWTNTIMGNTEFVVPTERADAIWHEHILSTREYREFSDALIGKYIDHFPGLEKGTREFNRAVDHTRKVHKEHGSNSLGSCGFAPMYLGGCGGSVSVAAAPAPQSTPAATVAASNCGSAPSSCGSSSSSCGGGGCGGGCGG